jgi:hypothetical protein
MFIESRNSTVYPRENIFDDVLPVSNKSKKNMVSDEDEITGKYKDIIPHQIYLCVLTSTRDSLVEERAVVIKDLCKYWCLKRLDGNGAPLLRRLHLEV